MRTKILIVVIVIIIFILICLIMPWGILWLGLWMEPNPTEPVHTYGEFPFELQYEIEGTLKTINGTIICEYKGIEINEASGKKRKWESRIAGSDNNRIVLLKISELEELYYNPGSAEYYMGDYSGDYRNDFPNARIIRFNAYNSGYQDGCVLKEELYNKYNIKLLKWKVAPPIQNIFK